METFLKRIPFSLFCVLMTLAALVPSSAIYYLSQYIFSLLFDDISKYSPPQLTISVESVLGTVVFAPVFETLILAAVIYFLQAIISKKIWIYLISAVFFGALHGLSGALWFFGTVWSFLVFTYCFLLWSSENSLKAFLAACIPHMLLNSVACLISFSSS